MILLTERVATYECVHGGRWFVVSYKVAKRISWCDLSRGQGLR